MSDIEYVYVTEVEVGDRIFTAFAGDENGFVITDIQEVEDDWAGEKPIGIEPLIEITFDADPDLTFRFRKHECIWRFKH